MTRRSHGPVLWQSDPADADTLSIRCMAGNVVCGSLHAVRCTAVKPPKIVQNVHDTPDWCPFRAQAEADMQSIKDNAV